MFKKLLLVLVIAGVAGASYLYYGSQQKPTDTYIATDTVVTGDVVATTGDSINLTGDIYNVVSGSVLGRKGSKAGGAHTGTIDIDQGVISMTGGQLVGGIFVIDMASLKILDITDLDFEAKLRDEFFEAKKYATSTFSITRIDTTISGTMVYGDLMIKGINQAINFPATVVSGPTGIQFKATFSIDRTLWNLTMREGMVNKFIEFDFDLFLTK